MVEAMARPWYRSPTGVLSVAWKVLAGLVGVVAICFVLSLPDSLQNPGEFLVRFLQFVINGVMIGSVYALAALGWTLIYKCSGVLNLAMGELTLIGGYVCLTLYRHAISLNMPVLLAFVTAVVGTLIIGIILGVLTERLVLRPMIGEPVLAVIMITVGLSFFFRGLIGMLWGTTTQVFKPLVFPTDPMLLGQIPIRPLYAWAFLAALILLPIFVGFFQLTRWGLSMQATADDEMAALSLGISAKFVYAVAWAIAFMTAGVGGIFLGNDVGLNITVAETSLLVLPAVVLGGLNSVPGAIVGGISIGVLQNLAGGYLDQLVIAGVRVFPGGVKSLFPYVVMIIVLLFKPYGLWGWVRIERV
jgi:branched-chain amino acid transport system permease protein